MLFIINIENKRNYEIDLLRIFSMINIIILHINKYCKMIKFNYKSPKFKSVWLSEIMSFWAVDCFGIISGIFGYKKYKFSNLIYLWVLTTFYSTIFSFLLYYIGKIRNIKSVLIMSFFPLLIKRHWYVNAYFSMYIFLPFINSGINNLKEKTFRKLIMFFILFYSIYNLTGALILGRNSYPFLNDGYSTNWLLILYIFGAYLAKFKLINKMSLIYYIVWILIYLISSFFSFEFFIILLKKENRNIPNKLFINYLSPTMLLQTISLIFIFFRLNIKNNITKKIISFFTPLTFSTTLIHTLIFKLKYKYINIFFKWIIQFKPSYNFFKIYGLGITIFIVCAFIDYLRLILFKLFKIRESCIFIEKKFPELIDKIYLLFN